MREIGKHMRGHFVAYLALFFALGGTSIAAVNALPKNSVGSPQIKNGAIQKVDLAKRTVSSLRGLRGLRGTLGPAGPAGPQGLKGDKGDTGAAGAAGAAGATGATGATGAPGPFPDVLPTGKTIRGDYSIDGTAAAAGIQDSTSDSFGFVLSAAPTAHFIAAATTPPAQCPGTAANPQALPGHLCVWESGATNVGTRAIYSTVAYVGGIADKTGFGIYMYGATAAGFYSTHGSWAVTSP